MSPMLYVGILGLGTLTTAVGVAPIESYEQVRVGRRTGYAMVGGELAFSADGPRKVGLRLHGDAGLHGRSIWVDIERDGQFVSENTLVLVDQKRGPRRYRAQILLELEVPAGNHTYRLRASDMVAVIFAPGGRAGGVVAAEEKPLQAGGSAVDPGAAEARSRSETEAEPAPEGSGVNETAADAGESGAGTMDSAQEPSSSTAPSRAGGTVGYDEGFFIRSADGSFYLQQNGRLQLRHRLTTVPTGPDKRSQSAAFTVPRAYVVFRGSVFEELVSFKTEVNFGEGFVYIKDGYADVALPGDYVVLRLGQWKRPFSRQQMNSSGKLQMLERGLTNVSFDIGRDIGFALHNRYEDSPSFEWAVGLLNGESINSRLDFTGDASRPLTNVRTVASYGAVARVGFNYGGIDGYSEPDLEGGPFRFAVAASGLWQFDSDNSGDAAISGELDFILKVAGFAANGAAYVATGQSGEGRLEQSLAALGFHVQMGYVIAGLIEPSARIAMHMPEGADSLMEATGCIAVYAVGHNVKAVTDISFFIPEEAGFDGATVRTRVQFQLAF